MSFFKGALTITSQGSDAASWSQKGSQDSHLAKTIGSARAV